MKWEQEIINIKISKKQYDFILKMSEKYKSKYTNKIDKLKQENYASINHFYLSDEINLIENYNKLVKNILKEVASEFSIFKKFSVVIFITGSFARKSNKLNSDVDIHFAYHNIFKKILWKYEEMYFYIISNILGIERNNLHSVITTKLSHSKLEYFKNIKDEKYLNVNLIYDNNHKFSYSFYPVTKKRFLLQYDNNKSLKAIYNYLKDEISNDNEEWAHTFYPIINEKVFNKMNKKLVKYEYNVLTNEKLLKQIKKVKKNIDNLNINCNNNIALIKKTYQQAAFGNIYNVLNIFRASQKIDNNNFTLDKIFKTSQFKKISHNEEYIYNIYYYLWIIKKLSIYCEHNNIIYSIHRKEYIDIQFMNEINNSLSILNESLKAILNDIERHLNYGK